MTTAAAANEIKSNIGFDYSLAAEIAEWEAEQAAEADAEAERQRINAAMREWFSIG